MNPVTLSTTAKPTVTSASSRPEALRQLEAVEPPADLRDPELTENATTVLERRYLKKDADTGKVVETPRQLFWRVAAHIAKPELAFPGGDARAGARGRARSSTRLMAPAQVHAQQPDADERGPRDGHALGLLRAAGRGLDRGHLRLDQGHGADPEGRRRHGLLVLAPAAAGRPRALLGRHDRGPAVLHPGLLEGHRRDPAGRVPARRQHGHPAHRPPRHRSQFITLQGRSRARSTNYNISVTVTNRFMRRAARRARRRSHQVQNPRTKQWTKLAKRDAEGQGDRRVLDRRRGLGPDRRARLAHRRAGRRLHRPHQRARTRSRTSA